MNITLSKMPKSHHSQHITIDIEEWFHILETPIPKINEWNKLPATVERNIEKMLEIFSINNIQCTFFSLGWVAKKNPLILKKISNMGHEIGSHGFYHEDVRNMKKDAFYLDILTTKKVIEDIIGKPVYGYRSPGFTGNQLPFLYQVGKAGYKYDSSFFKRKEALKGSFPIFPEIPFVIKWEDGLTLMEYPVSRIALGNFHIPCGGGYFRILPAMLSMYLYREKIKATDGYFMFYIHPREIDEKQPKCKPMKICKYIRTYINIKNNKKKFEQLCSSVLSKAIMDF